jgi:hypothetical protein
MAPNPTFFYVTARAEHELRVWKTQRFGRARSALRAGHDRTERTSLRRRAGGALVSLGQRLGGMPLPVAARP